MTFTAPAIFCMLQSSCHLVVHFGDQYPCRNKKSGGPTAGTVKPAELNQSDYAPKNLPKETKLIDTYIYIYIYDLKVKHVGVLLPKKKDMPLFNSVSCQNGWPAMIEEVRTRQVPIGTPPATMPHHCSTAGTQDENSTIGQLNLENPLQEQLLETWKWFDTAIWLISLSVPDWHTDVRSSYNRDTVQDVVLGMPSFKESGRTIQTRSPAVSDGDFSGPRAGLLGSVW